jgi:response regulator RpfG family c-di-GMP phosphodiesterase
MGKQRILVVEEDETSLEHLVSTLNSADYTCRKAGDGRKALSALNSGEEFALVLSDVVIAGVDGLGLLEHIKANYPDTPVVLKTAASEVSLVHAALWSGAYDYLLQPFEREQLLLVVRRALEYRRLKLEKRELQCQIAARSEQLRVLERSYDMTLEALAGTLDWKAAHTQGHQHRVAAFSIALSRAMGLPGDQIKIVARGAFLHDIGKIAIPDAILRKPGALSKHELALMREYCRCGYQMLKEVPFLSEVAEIVHAHREHHDGTGYPRGLRGEQIPLGARLIGMTSALESITSHHPYRAAESIRIAREKIESSSGRQFDPELVRTFLSLSEAVWSDLRRQIGAHIHREG